MFHGVSTKQFFINMKREIREDRIFNGAAALAYYLTLAIFPALIFMMTIIPYLPVANIDQAIMNLLSSALPSEASDMIEKVVRQMLSRKHGGLLSFSLLGTLWAMSTGMYAIIKQLNITYDVTEGRNFFKVRAIALGLSLLAGLLLIAALTLVMLGGSLESWLGLSGVLSTLFSILRWLVIVAALLSGFAMIYYFGPDVEQDFRFITPGSVIGVLLLILASLGFSFYVSHFADYSATYGSIGAVIILMLWLYITGLVILLGSETNALIEHYSASGKVKGQKEL